jgi:hypothetical protein
MVANNQRSPVIYPSTLYDYDCNHNFSRAYVPEQDRKSCDIVKRFTAPTPSPQANPRQQGVARQLVAEATTNLKGDEAADETVVVF